MHGSSEAMEMKAFLLKVILGGKGMLMLAHKTLQNQFLRKNTGLHNMKGKTKGMVVLKKSQNK